MLFLSSYEDDEAVLAAVVGGAAGYLLKHVNAKGLLQAIHTVAQGQSILDPASTQPLLTHMLLQKEEAFEPQQTTLSTQQQVFRTRCRGENEQGNRLIAQTK